MRFSPTRTAAAVLALALVGAACGDSDDGGDEAAIQEYCDLMALLDEQDGPPTAEQLTEVKDLAPDAVAEDIATVADAFLEAGANIGAAFADPAVGEALERVESHDVEACGFDEPDGGDEEQVTEPAEGAAVVEISAVDFAFEDVPDEIAAGSVAIGFTNNGESAHEMAVFKLGDGVVLDDLLAAETEPTEEQATEIGGTFGTPGEGPFYVNAELEPGTYALVCFIPGPDEKPHFALGMKATFTVA